MPCGSSSPPASAGSPGAALGEAPGWATPPVVVPPVVVPPEEGTPKLPLPVDPVVNPPVVVPPDPGSVVPPGGGNPVRGAGSYTSLVRIPLKALAPARTTLQESCGPVSAGLLPVSMIAVDTVNSSAHCCAKGVRSKVQMWSTPSASSAAS